MGSSNDGSDAAQGAADDPTEGRTARFLRPHLQRPQPRWRARRHRRPARNDRHRRPVAAAFPASATCAACGSMMWRSPRSRSWRCRWTSARTIWWRCSASTAFRRLPVYKGTLDHPQGLVLLKDLALQHGFGAARAVLAEEAAAPDPVCAAVDAGRRPAAEDAEGPRPHGAGDRRIWRGRWAGDDRGPDRDRDRRDRGRA